MLLLERMGPFTFRIRWRKKIFQVKDGQVSEFASGTELEHPNGLLIEGDKLIVASWGLEMADDWSTKTPGNLFSIDLATKKRTLITKKPLGNLDGLEKDNQGNYLTTDWVAGKVFRVTPTGKSTLLIAGFIGPADIGFIKKTDTLIIPRMGENMVSAMNLVPPRVGGVNSVRIAND